ncbi:MAG TPA: hypothetical protein VGM82_11865 [Gemmatimonadaceae bacterium]
MRLDLRWIAQRATTFAALIGMTAALGARAGAQTDSSRASRPNPGRIVGVFDAETSGPVPGAEITDLISGTLTHTLSSGLFGMAAFQSQHDSSVIRIRKVGYADTTVLVMVGRRDTVPMQIFVRRATALPAVSVDEKETIHLPSYMHDFEDRVQKLGNSGAAVFTPQELRGATTRRLADVLRSKGVGMTTARCHNIALYRNGHQYHALDSVTGTAGIPDDPIDNYEAIIYYRAEQVPPEFRHDTRDGDCGVLLMYTRIK